jgi:hypothetical protein
MSMLRRSKQSTFFRLIGGCAALSLAAALGACAAPAPGGPIGGNGPDRIPADDPADDERLDALGIICQSTLNVTGTFVQGIDQPADLNGCWPVGTWTVNATIDRLGCDPQPNFGADEFTESFVYDVTYDEENTQILVGYANDPDDERVNLKISTAGDSLCHGSMDHFALDGTVIGFRPTLQLDGTLEGIGTYTVFSDDTF